LPNESMSDPACTCQNIGPRSVSRTIVGGGMREIFWIMIGGAKLAPSRWASPAEHLTLIVIFIFSTTFKLPQNSCHLNKCHIHCSLTAANWHLFTSKRRANAISPPKVLGLLVELATLMKLTPEPGFRHREKTEEIG